MNKVLKTYEDGSEFKAGHIAFIAAVGMIPVGVILAKDWLSTSKRWSEFKRKHSLEQG